MHHRIFIALNISNNLKSKIDKLKKKFKENFTVTFNKIRWLKNENLHITLIPPFYVSETDFQNLIKILEEVVSRFPSFDVNFHNVSYGPYLFNPRLIWITAKATKEISILKNALIDIMAKSGFLKKSDLRLRRDFLPHLTIARFKQPDFKYFNVKKIDEKFEFKERLNEVILFESILKKEGAEYKILKKFYLKN